jgi:hypothetical protein
MSDLETLAPQVRDVGLVRGFRDLSAAYSSRDANGDIDALDDIDASCAAAGLDH